MGFETVMQAPGRFDIELVSDAPDNIKALTARAYCGIVVTPAPVDNPEKINASTLLGLASYLGIHTQRSKTRTTFSGFGPAWLLTLARQEEEVVTSKRPLYDGSNTSLIRNNVLRTGVSEGNGVTVGTIASSATPTRKYRIREGETPLETLAGACRIAGRNWRVNPAGTLDVSATLFVSTPTVVATPPGGGRDLNMVGLPGVEFDERDDWDDYATEVVTPFTAPDFAFGEAYVAGDTVVATSGVVYECNTGHTSSGANLPPGAFWDARDSYGTSTPTSNSYTSPYTGSAIVSRRVAQARNATTYDDAVAVADQQLARFDNPQREITLSTDAYELAGLAGGSGRVNAGDQIYVYDVDNDLYSTASAVPFGGRLIHPATVRVMAVREAVDASKGVCCFSWTGPGGTFSVTDLSPYIAWESPGSVLELGEPKRLRPQTGVSL